MLLSIVICTHNRADQLRACLASLRSIDDDRCEVIVIDNNSSDETRRVCQTFADESRGIRYVFEPRLGLSIARNAGLQAAAGEYVAFIDDDAVASPDYVDHAIRTIETFSFDCFGGAFIPSFGPGRPKWYHERYETPLLRDSVGVLPESAFPYGGNFVVRRALAIGLGGFSAELGMRGGRIGYGEETLLQMRIRQTGGTIGFDPGLRVFHSINPRKHTIRWQVASAFASGRDSWTAFDRPVRLHYLAYVVFMLVAQPIFRLVKAAVCLLRPNYYLANAVVDVCRAAAHRLGQIAGGLSLVARSLRAPSTRSPRPEPGDGPSGG